MSTISIKGLDKYTLLAELYNNSVLVASRGEYKRFKDTTMTSAEARKQLGIRKGTYIEYLYGRPLFCDVGLNELDPTKYDSYNGEGAMETVVRRVMLGQPTRVER